ncbi:BMP family lipoprotein [Paraliobacillus ryukyuensis]|uniref:BMP family lipoprotein n=1 Tax=Paraliobacillus ryukyuensis TaxID=200904 RepID=UPI0009A62D1A|nr:BMP family ABC transporter substrate-binding protein [Paraliobacillus ryukyuensis]
MKNKKIVILLTMIISLLVVAGCGQKKEINATEGKYKVGVMLSDVGLGDQSFSDLAFNGLVQARDNLDVVFDYREIASTETYEQGFRELVEQGNDLVIAVGYQGQEDLEKVAKEYPDQEFLLIDSVSELENITSVSFRVDQASYLAGVVSALTTKTDHLGFIGGEDVPIIHDFYKGFESGAKSVNPDIVVDEAYAGTYNDDKLGAQLTREMIDNDADILFAAAGFTGVGVLKEAQAQGKYAIGVDTDQYFQAEEAVITSVMKNIDKAIYQIVEQQVNGGSLSGENLEFGISNEGVGLAPLRVADFPSDIETKIEAAKEQVASQE